MKVLIDFSQIPKRKTGVGIYALNLVRAIVEADKFNDYFVTLQDDEDAFDTLQFPNLHLIRINGRIFRRLPMRIIFEQCFLPLIALFYRVEAIHSLHYTFPLACFVRKKIVTIHDLTFIKYPHYHLKRKRFYFSFFLHLAHRMVTDIITVSESTKNDLITYTRTDPKMIEVIHLGVQPMPSIRLSDIESVQKKYGISRHYFLFIGVIEPRKNLVTLIKAFNDIYPENTRYRLVIAGKKGWQYQEVFNLVNQLNLTEKITFTGYVEEKDKPILMKGAKIFIYPSVYEGFGLPVLEAMHLGVPTIASNGSSIPEFAGNAAFLVNIDHVDAIASAIRKLLDHSDLYKEIATRSVARSAQYTWAKTARRTIDVYTAPAI